MGESKRVTFEVLTISLLWHASGLLVMLPFECVQDVQRVILKKLLNYYFVLCGNAIPSPKHMYLYISIGNIWRFYIRNNDMVY